MSSDVVIEAAPADVSVAPACAAASTTVLTTWSAESTFEIGIDDAFVYFHGDAGIARVPKGGGAAQVLAPGKIDWPFVLRSATLDWVAWDSTGSSLLTLPKAGGVPTPLLPKTTAVFDLLTPGASDDVLLWSSYTNNQMLLFVTDTGVVTRTWTLPSDTTDVEIDDDVLYFALEYGGVSAIPLEGGGGGFLGKGPGQLPVPTNIRFDPQTVYFMNYDYNTAGRWILSVPKAGGTVSILASHPDGKETYGDMRVAGSVYFTETQSGRVWRMNPDGSSPAIIGASQQAKEGAFGLAVDELCVYWRSASRVYAAPRGP